MIAPDLPTADLHDARFDADLHGYIDELRAQSFAAITPDGHLFLNQEDAAEVMRCEDFRFAFAGIDHTTSPYLANAIEHELLNMHGPEHVRLKKLVSAALRDRVVESLEERIREVTDDLIDEMPDDGVIDFALDFADPLPGRILGPMYGIPYDDAERLNDAIRIGGRKSSALLSGEDLGPVEDANRYLHDYLRELLAERRNDLGEDIFSELIIADIDGDTLSDDELVYLTSELASAGVDTTREQLPLIMLALLEHPDQQARLWDDPSLALRAVDEGMRYAPLPWALPHTAIRDVNHKGIAISQGDLVSILVPAVNRDPAVVDQPHEFDIGRPRTRNFSFGYGAHVCPAAHLARIEMSVALQQLVARVESVELAEPPTRNPVQKSATLTSLKLKIRKRPGATR